MGANLISDKLRNQQHLYPKTQFSIGKQLGSWYTFNNDKAGRTGHGTDLYR